MHSRRPGRALDGGGSDHAQRALAADEQLLQVVPCVVLRLPGKLSRCCQRRKSPLPISRARLDALAAQGLAVPPFAAW